MVDLYQFFYDLEGMGVYDYVLPFLLVFTILFAVLQKTKILGVDKRNLDFVVAFIIALLVVVRTDVVWVMNQYLSKMALVIIIVIVFLLLIGVFGASVETGFGGTALTIGVIIAILAVIWALTPTFGLEIPYWLVPGGNAIIVIALMIFVLLVVLGGGGQGKGVGGSLKSLGEALKGK